MDKTVTEVSFGLDRLQQSVVLQDRQAGPGKQFKELADHIAIWREFGEDIDPTDPDAWGAMDENDWTAFDLAGCREHKRIIGDTIKSIELLCELEDFIQCGMVVTWSSGHCMTVTVYYDGCTVLAGAHYGNSLYNVIRVIIDMNSVFHS